MMTTKNETDKMNTKTTHYINMSHIIRSQEEKTVFFEKLHHLLWNESSFAPPKALEHMILFFAYRLLDPYVTSKKLSKHCSWSYISQITDEIELDQTIKKGINEFRKDTITKPYFIIHEIKKADTVKRVIDEINKNITDDDIENSDILGDVFEYMLGRGMSTMADDGQYFTNRHICKKAFELAYKIKGTLQREDGSLCTFADFFCGTGGFLTEYIKAVKNNIPLIDWNEAKSHLYAMDKDMSSIRTTLLNCLVQTHVPFENRNIREYNSFQDSITMGSNAPFKGLEIDYMLTNPPYGGDKTKGKDYKFAYYKEIKNTHGLKEKIYQVNSDIQSIGVEDHSKVSAGVQLAMATISKNGGVAAIVLPEGFFFGSTKKDVELRKKIAEEYKICYVVTIESGAFANTGTKTSMIVFQRGVGSTEKIVFMDMDDNQLTEATLEDIRAKKYSLNYKQYIPQIERKLEEGFEMVKIKDIVDFNTTKCKKNKEIYHYIDIGSVDKGKLNMNEPILKENLPGRAQYSVDIGDILIGTVRPNLEHYLLITPLIFRDDLIVSNGFSILRCNKLKIIPAYLYYIISHTTTTTYLTERATGTNYPVIDNNIIGEYEIPLPSLEKQQEIVDAIDDWAMLANQEEVSLNLLEKQVMRLVKLMGHGQPRVKLGDLFKPVKGKKYNVTKGLENGKYPLISSALNIEYYMNDYSYDIPSLIFNTINADGNCAVHYFEKFNTTSNTFTITCQNKLTLKYIYYYLKTKDELLKNCFHGTTKKALSRPTLLSLEIPIPSLEKQQRLQPIFDEIRHKYERIVYYKELAQQAIQEHMPQ